MTAATPLISHAALAAALTSENPPTLLDVRWRPAGPPGIELYRAAHLPGARYADLDTDLAAPIDGDAGKPVPTPSVASAAGTGGRHPLPTPADFSAAMRRLGVTTAGDVVVYDDGDATIAARAWWLLRHAGHSSVRVLDGGLGVWRDAGHEIETGDGVPAPEGDFSARDYLSGQGRMPVLDAVGAAQLAREGHLLDARAGERYRGEIEPLDPVAGHVPGAISAPTRDNSRSDGTFADPAELRDRFTALGVTGDRPIGVYCGSGVTATHQVLALELAGLPRAALYAGSWSEWISDPQRPVATGEAPVERI